MAPSKIVLVSALFAGASAFNTAPAFSRTSTALFNVEKGAGGMFDTRNPDAVQHEDARKSISAAPSFEEYMKQRDGGAAAAATPEPAAPAAPEAPAAGGSLFEEYMASRGGGAAAPAAPAAPAAAAPAAAAPAAAGQQGFKSANPVPRTGSANAPGSSGNYLQNL